MTGLGGGKLTEGSIRGAEGEDGGAGGGLEDVVEARGTRIEKMTLRFRKEGNEATGKIGGSCAGGGGKEDLELKENEASPKRGKKGLEKFEKKWS